MKPVAKNDIIASPLVVLLLVPALMTSLMAADPQQATEVGPLAASRGSGELGEEFADEVAFGEELDVVLKPT